jgi:protein O-GlcNAc transferase
MTQSAPSLDIALAHHQSGRLADAERAYRAILAQMPRHPDALHLLGLLAHQCGKSQAGADLMHQAIAVRDDVAAYYGNLGVVMMALGRADEAEAGFRKAILLDPASVDARNNLASLLVRLERFRDAADLYAESLRLKTGQPAILAQRALMLASIADWDGLDDVLPPLRSAIAAGFPVRPFPLLSLPGSPAEQLMCGRNWSAQIARSVLPVARGMVWPPRPAPGERIRIGYVSADFKQHAVASLIADLFERHDHARYEIHGFALNPDDGSGVRRRISGHCDHFVSLAGRSYADAAGAIAAAGIDILVDLNGHTAGAMPEIFALRPAPVQITWLGFPGTSGADFFDYALVDRIVAPPDHDIYWSEKLIRLPGCYQINDPHRPLPATQPDRIALGLPPSGVVFCCFNNGFKITRPVFAAWMRVLEKVPGSVLWLLDCGIETSNALRRAADDAGIAPDRLVFAPRVDHRTHMARLGAADLCLDTSPYNAHTTGSDALWAGLPMVTLLGETFVARVAASLLDAVGLAELVADDLAGYEALAIELALDPARRARLKADLTSARVKAPLFDSTRFARNLEQAYKIAWARHLAGDAPTAFAVSEDPAIIPS